jgi:hypothetical protein
MSFKATVKLEGNSKKNFKNHLKYIDKMLELKTDKVFQKFIQKKVLNLAKEITENLLTGGTTNDEDIALYKTSHKIRELDDGFELYNDAQIPADKYNILPFDTSGYPNGMFSVSLAFEYGVGIVGISDYGIRNGYVYNDLSNTKSKSHIKYGGTWYLPTRVLGQSGVFSQGYRGFEIYRNIAIESENQLPTWIDEYCKKGIKGGKE